MTDVAIDPEPCGWWHGHWRYGRTCMAPSVGYVTDGWAVAAVCRRHQLAALERGWRGVET